MKKLYKIVTTIEKDGEIVDMVDYGLVHYGEIPEEKRMECNDIPPDMDINLVVSFINKHIEFPFIYCEHPVEVKWKDAKMISVVDRDAYYKDHGIVPEVL